LQIMALESAEQFATVGTEFGKGVSP
jgi:hypothetical protein